jgi:Zn-dependent metalloprotease
MDLLLVHAILRTATKQQGIGKEKAGNIWYRALTIYFTPLTSYFMACLATITAAKDLYSDVEVEACWETGIQ